MMPGLLTEEKPMSHVKHSVLLVTSHEFKHNPLRTGLWMPMSDENKVICLISIPRCDFS